MDETNAKGRWLNVGLFYSIGVLGYFKYTNFFIDSFQNLFRLFHVELNIHTLNIVLPLAISFYTFRIISYLLDIYYEKIGASRNIVSYLVYVAFFPELLSGPIDRARSLLPQIEKERQFDQKLAIDGLRQILVGLFKKIVIADNCVQTVDLIFGRHQSLPGSTLVLGAVVYAVQIYTDFSGYSDMAIGTGKLLGFRLTKNFSYPFFSKNISDYWRKWHISLTSWLTDYVFAPLSIRLRDWGKAGLIVSIILTFIIVGAWHDAKWTWVMYGFVNGLFFIPLILKGNIFKGGGVIAKGKIFPSVKDFFSMLSTFGLVVLLFIINRSADMHSVFTYYKRIFSSSLFSLPSGFDFSAKTAIFILLLFVAEWLQRSKEHFLDIGFIKSPFVRYAVYYVILFCILNFGGAKQQFIYFQF